MSIIVNYTLRTPRLLLRPITDADIHQVYEGLSHPDVIRYYGVSFDSLEATEEQMRWYSDLVKNGTGKWWAVCSPDGSEFYGAGGFNSWEQQHRKAEYGFWLLPEYWGKGFMKEASDLLLDYGFTEMKLHRIEGFVDSGNSKCQKALKKIGFEYEGTMRDCEIKDGAFLSVEVHAVLGA